MTPQIIVIMVLTFVIYVIGTLAYSVRVVGVRTGRIAVAFAIFNIFALVSRTANTFQAPLLSNMMEKRIRAGNAESMIEVFRLILVSMTVATVIGAILIPTFIRLFGRAVESFSIHRSIPKVLLHGFSKAGVEQFKRSIAIPRKENFSELKSFRKIPKKIVILNVLATSIANVGVLASLYAGCLIPELRTTCSNLSPVINGFATIAMFLFIDPYISILTDDVIRGECSMRDFNRCIIFIVGGLIVGTILAQALLVPASWVIVEIVEVVDRFWR
ncbi:MAG: lipid II flippase Amj family protein [Clostridia bacterium]|nr:lipid II flippase Amj family protein [Clostridia bacterium]